MKISGAKPVYDLNEFLPPDGEDRANLSYQGSILRLEIFFEDKITQKDSKRVIKFSGVHSYYQSFFGGYSIFKSEEETPISLLNSLIEYERSDWTSEINKSYAHLNYGEFDLRHYRVILFSVGLVIHVACESWEISDAACG